MTLSRMMLGALLACLTALPARADAAHGTPPPTLAQIAGVLARMHDPDALVTAALMQPLAVASRAYGNEANPTDDANDRIIPLLQKAQKLEPASADIAGLMMMRCNFSPACDALALGRRLQVLDPDNAFAWLPALHRAQAEDNADSVTRILGRMAQSNRFDTYWIATLRRLDRGLTMAPTPDGRPAPADQHAAVVMALAGFAMPNYTDLIRACKPANKAFPQRRDSCRTLGLRLETSPMLISNMVGTQLHRWAASDPNDHDAAVAHARSLDWLRIKLIDSAKVLNDTSGGDTYFRDILRQRSEAAGIRALLARIHTPTRPPSDWVDRPLRERLQSERGHAADAASTRP